jgi:hypothetical protein
MNGSKVRNGMSWSARLLVGLVLIIVGAGAATWGLAHYQPAARFLGVTARPATPPQQAQPLIAQSPQPQAAAATAAADQPRLSDLEARLARVENATRQAQGSAGRADALVVAFAARRAIDRGVALGYLEPLLVDRFGAQHEQAVATIITASRQPVRLNDLISEYDDLGPVLRRGVNQESWWSSFKRELGSIVEVHRADQPAVNPDARYQRAQRRLAAGEVDQALTETMRLPGARGADDWVAKARRYILAHRALDEVESAALLGGPDLGR